MYLFAAVFQNQMWLLFHPQHEIISIIFKLDTCKRQLSPTVALRF
jgi:hypothetical protein